MVAVDTPFHAVVLSGAHDVLAGAGYGDAPAGAGAGGADGLVLCVPAAGTDVFVYVAHFSGLGGWVRTLWFDLVGVEIEIEIGILCRFLVVRIGGFELWIWDGRERSRANFRNKQEDKRTMVDQKDQR